MEYFQHQAFLFQGEGIHSDIDILSSVMEGVEFVRLWSVIGGDYTSGKVMAEHLYEDLDYIHDGRFHRRGEPHFYVPFLNGVGDEVVMVGACLHRD